MQELPQFAGENLSFFIPIIIGIISTFIFPILIFFFLIKKIFNWQSRFKDVASNFEQQITGGNYLESLFQNIQNATKKNGYTSLADPDAANFDGMKTELESFKYIKSTKEVAPDTLDLTVIHKDNSEHQYRALIKGSKINFKITQLTRYT